MKPLAKIELDLLRTTANINLRPTLASAWEAGRLLALARPLIPHGQWIPWLKRVGVSRSSAQEYLSVHAHLDEANVRQGGHLTIRQFLRSMRKANKASRREANAAVVNTLPSYKAREGLFNHDALEFMAKMPDDSVPFVITDPPFGLGIEYDGFNESDDADGYWSWFSPYVNEMKRVLQPGGMLVLCQAYRYLPHFWNWYGDDVIVTPVSFVIRHQTCWHPVVRWIKPGALELVPHNRMDAFIINMSESETEALKSVHPCPMPLNFAKELVFRYSREGAVVLDPFMGLGAIGIECRRQGRVYVGVEKSEKYYRIACQRMQ